MNYWRGGMDWPIERDWVCETCGHGPGNIPGEGIMAAYLIFGTLTWGLVHGVCRCNRCHTQYTMRPDGDIVTRPVVMLKPEYQEAAKWAWKKWEEPLDEISDYKWDKAMAAVEGSKP